MKRLTVEIEKLAFNLELIKQKAGNAKIIAVLKGNFYGLGAVEAAKFYVEQGIDFFAVSRIEDAVELREAGIECDILLLCSTCIPEEASIIIRYKLTAAVGSLESAVLLNGLAGQYNVKANAHLKVDTGFGRYGFLYNETDKIAEAMRYSQNIDFTGIFTQFSDAFGRNKNHSLIQFERFNNVLAYLKSASIDCKMAHISNSCALFRFPQFNLDAVRIGSALTGRLVTVNKHGLKRTGYLECTIQEIKWLPKGYNIGYGNAYKSKNPLRAAIIDVGTADGIALEKSRELYRLIDKLRYLYNDIQLSEKNALRCNINGRKAKVLGSTGFTSTVIDVTDIDCKAGDICVFDTNPMYINPKIERLYK